MNLTPKLRAGYPGLYIVTHEEQRAEAILKATAAEIGFSMFAWTISAGRFDTAETGSTYDEDALAVLECVTNLPEKTILVLKDYHLFLAEPNPLIFRKLKDALYLAKTQNKCIVILAPVLTLPPELEKLFAVVDLPLPDREQLKHVLAPICEGNGKKLPKGDALTVALDAARGLTSFEAEDAFALAIVEAGKLDPAIIAREKAETIRKNGILEIVPPTVTAQDIGGLDILKSWLDRRKNAFSTEAVKYGLPVPKGILIAGPPGTGKSLTGKAAASIFGDIPLLRLDAGSLFASHVGESEANIRAVTKLAEAIAPCVLWIDEIEKGFPKPGGHNGDSGVSDRVFGTLLQWMNDKTAPVFIVATANDITRLDAPLLRKGRFDEIFFVDLPNPIERAQIWQILITKYNRDPKNFDVKKLVEISEGCTGAEIEALISEALYTGFGNGREPNLLDIVEQTNDFIPISRTMAEEIDRLRKFTKGRARPASSPVATSKGRKLA